MISFSSYHPFVLLIYFVTIITISMFTFNPVLLILSLSGAVLFFASYTSAIEFIKKIILYMFLILIITITNPFFSHNGVTVLFFLNNKPVTLEALYYGAGIGAMLICVLLWFKSYTVVMTSDKFLFIFGKVSPRISLVISMIFKFIPAVRKQAGDVSNARKLSGAYGDEGFIEKLRGGITVFSIIVTWALETSIETAFSMKARGYGVSKRSHFSIFKFTGSDAVMLSVISFLLVIVFFALASNDLFFSYYPEVTGVKNAGMALPAYISFFILAYIPVIIEVKERIKWKYFLLAT